ALCSLRLAHAVADHLAAAELHLLAIGREIVLDLHDQIGVCEADAIASGGAEHVSVGGAGKMGHQSRSPITSPRKPCTMRLPAYGISATSRRWPGSKRMAVPAGMSSRRPRAAWRSNKSAGFVSAK